MKHRGYDKAEGLNVKDGINQSIMKATLPNPVFHVMQAGLIGQL